MKQICFIFLLVYCSLCLDYDSNLTVILQTFSAQQSMNSRSPFIVGQIGPNIDYDFEILNNEYSPLNFGNPFWLYQIDNNFHYLSFRFSNILKAKEVKISPLSIFVNNLNLFTLRKIHFTIQNYFVNETLIIRDIASFSKEIYTIVQNDTIIKPQTGKTFTIFLCPIRVGLFSTVLLISTNKGSIVYPITYESISTPSQQSIPTHFSISSLLPFNFTIDVPSFLKSSQITMYYDTSFIAFEHIVGNNQYKFLMPKLIPGYYITFLNLISPKYIRIFPLFFTVTPKLLQSFSPLILFPTITKIDDMIEMDIKVFNPTILTIQILSIHLESEAIPNLKIVHVKPPLDCDPHAVKVIGKLQMSGTKQGEINTNVVVLYDAGNMMVQTLEIPVKGYVSIGSFQSVKTIEIVGKDAQYIFNLTSRFPEYALIISAYTESDDFFVHEFSPFILRPKNTTRNIVISFSPRMNNFTDRDIIKSTLYIETNITSYRVPIIGYLGTVSISKDLSAIGANEIDNKINFTFSQILWNSEKYISFFIVNRNPISFTATLQSRYNILEIISSNKINIPKFSSLAYRFKVKFHDPNEFGFGTQNSTIYSYLYFTSCNKVFEIGLTWIGLQGEFILKSNRYKIVYGLKHNISVRLKSTYRSPIDIHNIECPINGHMINRDIRVEHGNEYEVYYLVFAFDSSFLSKFNYIEMNNELPVEFTFYLNDGFVIKSNLTIRFEFAEFPAKTFDSGLVPINSLSKANFTVKNFFDVPVEFEATHSKSHTVHFQTHRVQIVQPGHFFTLNLLYRPKLIGQNNFSLIVKSNATKSNFSMDIWYEGVNPSFSIIRIANNVEESVNNLTFSLNHTNQIDSNVFLKNDGNVTIPIETIDISPQIKFKTKCKSILPTNEKCQISIFINPKNLMRRQNELRLKVISCALVKTVHISVSIDEKTIWHLRMSHFLKFMGVLLIAIFPFLIESLIYESKQEQANFEFEWRSAAIEKETERLSVSKRSSVSTQTCTFERKPFVGRWMPPDIYKAGPASKTGVEEMTKIIENLK